MLDACEFGEDLANSHHTILRLETKKKKNLRLAITYSIPDYRKTNFEKMKYKISSMNWINLFDVDTVEGM